LKENVVIGRLIPAGTGYPELQNLMLESNEPIENKELEEAPVGEMV
jgi:hypothetical protein